MLEAFVTTDNNFSPDKGTSSKDLVWQLSNHDQHVLVNGTYMPLMATPAFSSGDTVRLIVDQNVAIVEVVSAASGKTQRLWAGSPDLGNAPRFVGARFLQTGSAEHVDVSVQQVKVSTVSQ